MWYNHLYRINKYIFMEVKMLREQEKIVEYFEREYDLEIIKKLPITDKFRLINYIKLVGKASDLAKEKGISAISQSELDQMDPTFHFLMSLIGSGIQPDVISQVIESYVYLFVDSDVYRSKLIILGAGTLMIQRGTDRDSMIGYLVSLLGYDFLKNNFTRIYKEKDELDLNEENTIDIKYQNFDYTYRKLKYDMLAFLKMRREIGYEKVKEIISNRYDNAELQFYFKLLDLKDSSISEHLFCKLMKDSPKMDRFILTSVRAILTEQSIIETHYLLNAVIGKYSRFEKPYSEVMEEIQQREKEILAL